MLLSVCADTFTATVTVGVGGLLLAACVPDLRPALPGVRQLTYGSSRVQGEASCMQAWQDFRHLANPVADNDFISDFPRWTFPEKHIDVG
jgi:hypothetical protein